MQEYHRLVDKFADFLATQGKQPTTIESYCRDAHSFCRYLGEISAELHSLTPHALDYYREYLENQRQEKPNSIRRSVIGIRQFFRFLHEQRLIASSPFDHALIPLRQEKLPSPIRHDDIEKLIALALERSGGDGPKAARDGAICSLLAYEGLKASELTALRWSDLLGSSRRHSLRITQARESRVITLHRRTGELLRAYRRSLDAWDHPFLQVPEHRTMMFLGFKGRYNLTPLPYLTRHGLKFMLYELGEKLAMPKLCAEHLRHFAITFLIAQGHSREEIMAHLGLRRLGTIAKYMALKPQKR